MSVWFVSKLATNCTQQSMFLCSDNTSILPTFPVHFIASNCPSSCVTGWTGGALGLFSDIILNIEFALLWVSTFSGLQFPVKQKRKGINKYRCLKAESRYVTKEGTTLLVCWAYVMYGREERSLQGFALQTGRKK